MSDDDELRAMDEEMNTSGRLAAMTAERDALRAKLRDAHVALAATAMGSDTTRTTIRDYLKALDEYNEIGDGVVIADYEDALAALREAAK